MDGRRLRGVCRAFSMWRASILLGSRQRHLGFFSTPSAAADAYDRAAMYAPAVESLSSLVLWTVRE